MPISVALPAPSIEWEYEFFHPVAMNNPSSLPLQSIGGLGLRTSALRPALGRRIELDSNQTAAGTWAETYAGINTGGAAFINRWETRLGRSAHRLSSNLANITNGEGLLPPGWIPAFGPASDFNPGARQYAGGLVAVIDLHISVNVLAAAPAWPNDTSPFFFLPDSPGAGGTVRSAPPGGVGAPGRVGGFGVFLNNVGGVPRYEYVSFSSVAILERVTIGLSIVPTVEDWNTIRYVIVGGRPGGDAYVSVQVNGFDVVVGRVFGSALLQTVAAMEANSAGLIFCCAANGGTVGFGDEISFQLAGKFGRFTPDGAEQQGE